MAEFVEVMGNWSRVCRHTARCMDCKVNICTRPHEDISREDAEEAEAVIMQWAAEHDAPTEDEEKLYRQGYELGYSTGRLEALMEVRRMLGES